MLYTGSYRISALGLAAMPSKMLYRRSRACTRDRSSHVAVRNDTQNHGTAQFCSNPHSVRELDRHNRPVFDGLPLLIVLQELPPHALKSMQAVQGSQKTRGQFNVNITTVVMLQKDLMISSFSI